VGQPAARNFRLEAFGTLLGFAIEVEINTDELYLVQNKEGGTVLHMGAQ